MTEKALRPGEAVEINLSAKRLQSAFETLPRSDVAAAVVSKQQPCKKGERYVSSKEAEDINNFGRNIARAFGVEDGS